MPDKNQNTAKAERAKAIEEDCLWTIVEASRFLNLAVGSVYHMVNQHRIPVVRISSRCIRFSRRALMEWVQSRTEPVAERD